MAASSAELDGSCNLVATTTSASVQLDSSAIYELSSLANMPAELGSGFEEPLPSTRMAGRSTDRSAVEALYRIPPLVSPISSRDQSQPSTYTESWYTSQSSAISALPTETSHSFTNDDRASFTRTSERPKLPTITTAWLCPPIDDLPISQITESPTDISAADQLNFPTLFGSTQDQKFGSQAHPAELPALHVAKSDSFEDMLIDIDTWPGQDTLATAHAEQHPFILGNAAITTGTNGEAIAPCDGKGLESYLDCADMTEAVNDDLVVVSLLAACEDYASILREDCPNMVVEYLRNTFLSTWSYCQQRFIQTDPTNDVHLEAFWPGEPSIEAGLEGLRDLMSDGWSTSHRLVSLLFLSFSLLCVSLPEDQDLKLAVLCLHQSARSWTAYVPDLKEALLLSAFVDNLWELAEHEGPQLHMPSGGNSDDILPDLISAYISGRGDFVLEIARKFIDATLAAGSLACSKDAQGPICMVDAPPSYADALHGPVLIPLACEAASGYPDSSTVYPKLNDRLKTDHSAGRTTSPDDVLGILRDHDLRKDAPEAASLSNRYTLPVLFAGFTHLARASRWVLTTLQRSSHRVVSNPTGLTPPRRSATSSEKLQASLIDGAYNDSPSPRRHQPTPPSSSRSKQIQRSRARATIKQPSKKIHSAENTMSYYCEEHDVTFTGKFARGAYHKHMTGTVAHNVERLSCPSCAKSFPRPDHLKTHCKDFHQTLMTGRAGIYHFEKMVDSKSEIGKGKMRAVTW